VRENYEIGSGSITLEIFANVFVDGEKRRMTVVLDVLANGMFKPSKYRPEFYDAPSPEQIAEYDARYKKEGAEAKRKRDKANQELDARLAERARIESEFAARERGEEAIREAKRIEDQKEEAIREAKRIERERLEAEQAQASRLEAELMKKANDLIDASWRNMKLPDLENLQYPREKVELSIVREKGLYFFQFSDDSRGCGGYSLKDLLQAYKIFDKYEEWTKQAIDNNVTDGVSKEIPVSLAYASNENPPWFPLVFYFVVDQSVGGKPLLGFNCANSIKYLIDAPAAKNMKEALIVAVAEIESNHKSALKRAAAGEKAPVKKALFQ
jgi:hypothetical protein